MTTSWSRASPATSTPSATSASPTSRRTPPALRDLAIEGVAPTADTVNAGDYPLARPLFIYSDPSVMAAKPQVAAFINFYLTYVNDEVIDVGYFPAAPDALDTAKQNWLDAMGQ